MKKPLYYIGHFYLSSAEETAARRLCYDEKKSLSGLMRFLLYKECLSRNLLNPSDIPDTDRIAKRFNLQLKRPRKTP